MPGRLSYDEITTLRWAAYADAEMHFRASHSKRDEKDAIIGYKCADVGKKLGVVLDEWDNRPELEVLREGLAQAEAKLRNIRQVCEDTPREPGDMESADISSAFLDVLTGALDKIQEKATP